MAVTHILVLANRTVASPALFCALRSRAQDGEAAFTLLVPAFYRDRARAQERLDGAVAALLAAGVRVEGRLGAEDPVIAIEEEYDNSRYDEIVVATLEAGSSAWLAIGLPQRIARLTGAVVHHVAVPDDTLVAAPIARGPREREPVLEGMLGLLHVDTNTGGHPYA